MAYIYIYIYIYIYFFFSFFFFENPTRFGLEKTKLQQSWSLDSDWTVRKQLKTIPQKRRKKVILHVDLGLLKQIHIYFVSPKQKIWFWRPKSISPYENFLNWSTEREKKKSPDPDNYSYFINLNKFWRKKKNRAWLVRKQSENQTVQIFITPQQGLD